jgi:N-acetylglucosamine-6-phosphate deacetylase
MNGGEIFGRHYATREPVRVAWQEGIISAVEKTAAAPDNQWLAPALVDLQVNGFAGIDFQQDNHSVDQLLAAVRSLRTAGCTRFLLTLITDDWPKLLARLRVLRALRATSSELQRAIAGWHIEGPFLSAETGFCGAQDPRWMRDPTLEDVKELRDATGNEPVLLTLAPERNGAPEAIQLASSLGIRVSLGHTNASAKILQGAVAAGAVAFTHLGNGCPRELDRHDNILWRVFEQHGLHVSLIPDGIHVSPALFRLAHRELGDRVFYVSDAMSAASSPPGRYKLGALELEVSADQIVRFPGRTNFAGSALRPLDGVIRAAAMLSQPWQEAWRRFSEIPAQLLGLPCGISVGAPAEFCVVKEVAGTLTVNTVATSA